MARDVVVTGLGAITPLGADAPSTWQALLSGESGVRKLEYDWAADLPTQIGAEVKVDPATQLDRVEARRMDRFAQLAVVAAREAWLDAGFAWTNTHEVAQERLMVGVATGIGGMRTLLDNWDAMQAKGYQRMSPLTVPMLMVNAAAGQVAMRLGAKAGAHSPVSACASANEAIAFALDRLRLGRADVALVGGAEGVVHQLTIGAFGRMLALSKRNDEPTKASRPWDVARDGFVLGEGAAMLVLETLPHAQGRKARIYGQLAGSGITNDAFDMVRPDPSGESQARAVTLALADAGLPATAVRHVNAHATSTPVGDTAEALSIRQALGSAVDQCVVTATKSMTGHLLGAAGGIESLATVLALSNRCVPPTVNLDTPEPGLGIDIATTARELPSGDMAAINNSFGFGGANVALAFTNAYANR